MNTSIDAKIHAFLAQSLDVRRNQVIAQQAEAALRFEVIDERIEEREYDEQERLRVDRVINRRVFRGEARERYAILVAGLQGQVTDGRELESQVRMQLDLDLRAIAADEDVRNDLSGALRRYSDLVPSEKWPTVLCMAQDPEATGRLRERLLAQGFVLLHSELLEKMGIVKLTCPPEINFVRQIAGLPETSTVADALTPVTLPAPMAVTTSMVESREIVGVTAEMWESYGHDVTLAVLDTGVDRNHPAFARLADEDYRDFTASGGEDVDGHGTHVAAIAAGDDATFGGRYHGIAPRCRLIAGKVLSPGIAGNLESILQGMAWAVVEKQADVLSLSLGEMDTPPTGQSIWSRACDEAFRKGTVVCVAAGNPMPSYPESICVPADSASAVTVGAIDKKRHLAPFSAQGSSDPASPLFGKPNCVGPGVDVLAARSSTAHFSPSEVVDARHIRLSGTSMATPAIAGCLTLLKSKARALGWVTAPAELVDLFYAACRPLEDPQDVPYRSDMQVGHGLIDMAEAFREAERRAPEHARPAAEAAPSRRTRETPPAPATPAHVSTAAAPEAPAAFEPDVCYRCGKRYLSKVGVFSPAWKCRECGAPICQVCWQLGNRGCEKHKESAATAGDYPAGPPPSAAPAAGDPVFMPARAGASAGNRAIPKGISPMTAFDPDPPPAPIEPSPCWGDTFANRFELKVRNAGCVAHPWSGTEFKVDAKAQAQVFRRTFGDVTQFALTSGLLNKERLTLAAICLERTGLATMGEVLKPAESIFQQIAGPDGLNFEDEAFYCVGIFSPAGWPEEWRDLAEIRSNAMFYLVEKGAGTAWNVFGPKGPLRNLSDPETAGEKQARAARALADHPKLIVSGDQITMNAFLEEYHLDRESAEAAIQTSGGRFQILEYKGKSYIQRSIR